MTFTPGTNVSREVVNELYRQLDDTLTKAFAHALVEPDEAIETRVKGATFAMTGSWLKQHRYDYRVANSSNISDAAGPVTFQRGDRV